MSVSVEQLQEYSRAVEEAAEEDAAPTPVLLLDKFRLRLFKITDLPIISNYSNIPQLGLSSDDVLLIDLPTGTEKKAKNVIKSTIPSSVESESEEVMEGIEEDEEDDKENTGGPLVTSFLTLEKLQKGLGNDLDLEIAGFDFEAPKFDVNPVQMSDGISIQRYLRLQSSDHFTAALSKLPVWIATSLPSVPSVCWLATGRTAKNLQFSGATRVLGYLNESTNKFVNQLNEACGAASVNRYRAVYDNIRRIATQTRENPGEVIVDMRWHTKNSLVLLEQPDNAAECTIKIDLGWRDKRFYIDESIFEQLFFVLNLADVLANPEKEVVFPNEFEKFDDLVELMNKLVETCSDEENVFVSKDTSEEVTDKVWNIVRRCGDIKQATLLFKNFLQALTYGKIKSHVLEDNKSHLAALIRASKTCEFRMPILERLSTIEMMMEIGVQSLRGRIVDKFSNTLKFPSDELSLVLKTCENDLKSVECVMNVSVVSLLPITMALATVHQIFGLLNDKDHVILPDLARRVLMKYTSSMVEKSKKGETELNYSFETTLPLLRINKDRFMDKRPRIWTCENSKHVGANVHARMMTCLELETSLENVSSLVNSIRPVRETKEDEKPTVEELNAEYTVSHTVFTYFPKI